MLYTYPQARPGGVGNGSLLREGGAALTPGDSARVRVERSGGTATVEVLIRSSVSESYRSAPWFESERSGSSPYTTIVFLPASFAA
jgi:hypothetical protein